MRPLLLLSALALTAGACSSANDVTVESVTVAKQVALSQPFTLQRGKLALLADDGATIRFDSVSRDSRCPEDVSCVRAGEAFAHFTLMDAPDEAADYDPAPVPFTLEMAGLVTEVQDLEQYAFQQVDRFSVALLLLEPYPNTSSPSGAPPTATLEVRHTMR